MTPVTQKETPTSIQFGCTGCGLCCKKVGEVIAHARDKKALNPMEQPYRNLVKKFPYNTRVDGSCEKLDLETNQCTVYNDRPLVCRVGALYAKFFFKKGVSKKQYYDQTAVACNSMITKAELDKKFLVKPHGK